MRNALITINFNDFLSDNVRASFQDAARRWGAEYVEITPANAVPGRGPLQQKFHLFDFTDADRIVCIDADAILREDAPSPFLTLPEDRFCAAPDSNPHQPFPEEHARAIRDDHAKLTDALGLALPFPESYFNSGFFVIERKRHAPVLARANVFENAVKTDLLFREQATINAAVAEAATPIFALDPGWNWITPHAFGHWNGMERWMYHFAGSGDRWTILPKLSWRTPPNPWTDAGATYIPAKRLHRSPGSALLDEAIHWSKSGTGQSGDALISYGPYCTMSPGRKRVEVRADLTTGGFLRSNKPLLRIQLTHSHGRGRIAETVIHRREPGGVYALDFTLESRTLWFEVVLRAEPGLARCRVEGLTLIDLPSA